MACWPTTPQSGGAAALAVQRPIHLRIAPFPPVFTTKNGQARGGFPPPLRCLAYGCRLPAALGADHLMLLGSPPDMVHGAPVAQGPHPYAEQRTVLALSEQELLYNKVCSNATQNMPGRAVPAALKAARGMVPIKGSRSAALP